MSVVLVAGGATGIGAAALRAWRDRGHTVLLADRDADRGRALVAEDRPGPAAFHECDLGTVDGPAEAVAAAADLGDGKLDVVFYNAAVLEAYPLSRWTSRDWDRASAVNLRGPFLTVQAAEPHLRRSPAGRVVVTSSTGALRGHAGMPAYHATKAGLLGLVRALADELGPAGVTVNALCPGWVDTPFNDGFWAHQSDPDAALAALTASIPLRRQALPEDLVGTILFLSSPASAYLTGQALVVDGGYTAV
ncbi:SDR family NAD(P)-dependent oxidoreductase [Micromonospora sp. RP3T]|uniref:SDR family NAD(P)-dependent oxidoreductase n=1 Tax=Micromonospora sp. RP3T TaxID=2135446 RepID=UPI000D16FC63|nr:SDR family oxidoreductase [Micromonospora sp. RP3T]PTA47490.1 NAD(P)-dependent oxidoreductase [Micromonospora sp. RP3T]